MREYMDLLRPASVEDEPGQGRHSLSPSSHNGSWFCYQCPSFASRRNRRQGSAIGPVLKLNYHHLDISDAQILDFPWTHAPSQPQPRQCTAKWPIPSPPAQLGKSVLTWCLYVCNMQGTVTPRGQCHSPWEHWCQLRREISDRGRGRCPTFYFWKDGIVENS